MQPLALAQPLGALLRAGRGVRHAVWRAVGGGRPVEARACARTQPSTLASWPGLVERTSARVAKQDTRGASLL